MTAPGWILKGRERCLPDELRSLGDGRSPRDSASGCEPELVLACAEPFAPPSPRAVNARLVPITATVATSAPVANSDLRLESALC